MRIGIDVGGTKIEGILLGDDGREAARRRVATPRDDYPGTLQAIVDVVGELGGGAAASASVGIGIPGTISSATGLVKNANSTWLIGRPLFQDLEPRLGPRIRIANDANCFALSEAADGAGAGADVVFGVIVGTGTGAGVVVRGRLVEGRHGIAGEWGHNPLPWPEAGEWPGPACYCGRSGCIETFLSGPGLSRDHADATGTPIPADAIAALVSRGDRQAGDALARYARRMARALAGVINVLDPDVIVLGGGMSNIDQLYEWVPTLWKPFVFSDAVTTPLVRARHGDSSGVRGAAWLWPA